MLKNLLPSVGRRSETPLRRRSDHPFFSLQREMNQVFDDFFRGFAVAPFGGERFGAFSPSVDIREGDKEVTVRAELPGLDEKNVEVTLADDTLTIKGEKQSGREDKGEGYYLKETSYGSFQRVIPLPAGIDQERAEARFKNGVLTVTLPWQEGAKVKTKKIAIKAQ